MTALELIPHPANGSDAVTSIVAHVRRRGDELTMLFRTRGARALVVWPGHLPQGFSDGLWRHTCFEAFVMAGARPAYVELNIAPSRRWAAYRFDGYRSGMRRAAAEPIGRVATYRFDTTVYARFRIPDLSPGAAWRVGVSAVIELHDGTRNYFALAHPEGNPDFHNPDCFIATLPAPAAG